jgi:hypothetical protein
MASATVTIATHPMSATQAAAWRKLWALLLSDATPRSSDAASPGQGKYAASITPPSQEKMMHGSYLTS